MTSSSIGSAKFSSCSGQRFRVSGSSRRSQARAGRITTEYDIYAAYCDDDEQDILPLLDVLRQDCLNVYDPNLDAQPNETLIQAWLENGIYKCRMSVIFLTKQFLNSNLCRYQAEHAVMRYAVTRGRHRILVVMLESCKVPKNMRRFHCVYAWKFRETPIEQHRRILNAIGAPGCKIRRGSFMWTNSNCRLLGKIRCIDLPTHSEKQQSGTEAVLYRNLLFNLNKVKITLENCELVCKNCPFRVPGHRVLVFCNHAQVCDYQKVTCRFCKQATFRKNRKKHEESTCRNRLQPCPNEFCGRRLTVREMEGHLRVCSYKEETCPNSRYGCLGVFARKDKEKHFEICDFVRLRCKCCDQSVFRVDIDSHSCQMQRPEHYSEPFIRPDESYRCTNMGCDFIAPKAKVDEHERTCEWRTEQCSECGMRLLYRDLPWHRRECDKMTECTLCHQVVPRSCKQTHDLWICCGQNIRAACEKCHILVCNEKQELHHADCTAPITIEGVAANSEVNRPRSTSEPATQPPDMREIDSGIPGIPVSEAIPTRYASRWFARNFKTLRLSSSKPVTISTPKSGGMNVHSKWTPDAREKWRLLMELQPQIVS